MDAKDLFQQSGVLLREAEPGNDFYGVLEKTAYHLYLIRPSETSERT